MDPGLRAFSHPYRTPKLPWLKSNITSKLLRQPLGEVSPGDKGHDGVEGLTAKGQSWQGLRGIFHLRLASDLPGTEQITGKEKGPLVRLRRQNAVSGQGGNVQNG